MTEDIAAGQAFYSALQTQAMDAVKTTFKSELYPIQYPAQGDFPWNWQNSNQVFNDATYQYLDALVSPGQVPGTAALSTGGGFANAYVSVINAMTYSLSTSDQAKLNQCQSNASVQAGTIVSDYQNSFGPISPADLATAGVKTKLDYVINYVLGTQWSGTAKPLSYVTMAGERNLKKLLPYAPASGDQIITDVSTYLNLMAPVNSLIDELANGSWMLGQLKTNATGPSQSNGGMQTFDPNTGTITTGYNVGWTVNTPIQTITNDLQNLSRTIEISMTTAQSSGNTLQVNVAGEAGFTIGSWLEFSAHASTSYDMSKTSGTSTECKVTISYAGYSMVAASPSAWQQATNVGFYWADPIQQAAQNQGQDVTGFSFVSAPPYNLTGIAEGGGFGLLTNLLIANYPTIKISYSHADYQTFTQDWNENVSGNLTLFGFIKLGSFSQGAYGSSVKAGSDNSSFTVTFSPSKQLVGVPQNQQAAYVLAGAVANPGA